MCSSEGKASGSMLRCSTSSPLKRLTIDPSRFCLRIPHEILPESESMPGKTYGTCARASECAGVCGEGWGGGGGWGVRSMNPFQLVPMFMYTDAAAAA